MTIKRINEFPEGSGSLSNDDVFLFMDDPSNGGTTKKISLSQISAAIGGGGGSSSFDAAVEWTTNHTLADGTRYLANDLVYNSGNLYRAKFDNESIPVTDTIYWENVGPGYRLNIDGRDIPNIPNPFNQNLNTFDAPTFNTIAITGSQIFGGGENSGDGNGYSTIELVPDSDLYVNDQYLIVDPTAPNHIHLRAGGNIDSSNAELIVGGEHTNVRIIDNNQSVVINADSRNTFNVNLRSVNASGYGGNLAIVPLNSNIPVGATLEINGIIYTVVESINNMWDESIDALILSPDPTLSDPPVQLDFDANRFINITYPTVNHAWVFGNDGNLNIPGNILLNNGTSVATGTYDNNTGGNNGISLNCAVGYELNWQGGHLRSSEIGNSSTTHPLFVDSPIRFPGTGEDDMTVSASGLTFPDGTILNSANISAHNHAISDVTGLQTVLDLKINSTEVDTDLVGGPGISLSYNSSDDSLSISSNNENYIAALGGRSGSTPINYDPTTSSIQTLTLDGTATTFTKGTGWPTASNISVDTILRITVTSATSITWSIVNDWFAQPPAGALSIGTHIFLLRAIGSSIIEGHYIGSKTN